MFSKLKYLFLFLIFAGLYLGYSYYSYFQDFQLVSADMKGKGVGIVIPPKTIADCCKLSKVPEKVTKVANQVRSSPLNNEELIDSVEASDIASCKPFVSEGYDNFKSQIKLSFFNAKPADKINIASGTYDYRVLRETARIFGFLGRYYAVSGDSSMAIKAILSCASLAPSPLLNKPEKCTLIGQMVAMTIFKIAGQCLIDVSKEITPNKKLVEVIFENFKILKSQLPDLYLVAQMEKKSVTCIDYAYELQSDILKKKGISNPASRLKLVVSSINDLYREGFDEYLPFLEKPFPQGIEKIRELESKLIDFQSKYFNPFKSLGIFDVFYPAKVMAKILFIISFPNYKGAYTKHTQALQILDGSVTVLAIYAYKNENGSFPEELGVLEKWLGFEIAEDHFSGKKLIYKNDPLELYSVGEDQKSETEDDFRLLPDYKM